MADQYITRAIIDITFSTKEEAEAAEIVIGKELIRIVDCDGSILTPDLQEQADEWGYVTELKRYCCYCNSEVELEDFDCCDGAASDGESAS